MAHETLGRYGASLARLGEALRAAALLLNREVCRHVMACRADLTAGHRAYLERLARRAWDEASALYSSDVWEFFEIDEADLRRRALNLAHLRQTGQVREAAEAEREALRRALSATKETSSLSESPAGATASP